MKAHASAAAVMAAFLFCAPQSSPAHAETTLCTEITALPITITMQGVYCLKKNLNVNLAFGNAITINAGNVTIDFNGFRVNNQAPLATNQAQGVFAEDRKNITLMNGFIRGFSQGVHLEELFADASGGHLIEGMKIADSGYTGIWAEGDKSVVRDNRIFDIGGGFEGIAYGMILLNIDDSVVSGNIIADVSETSASYGLYVITSNRVQVIGNSFSDIDGGYDVAIAFNFLGKSIIAGNKLLNDPGTGTGGIEDVGSSSAIACRDNESAGFTATPFTGCDVPVDNVIYYN